jgi:hypothetical protein
MLRAADNGIMQRERPPASNEIILEFTPIGNLMRVAALDPITLTEVVFQAPLAADETTLTALARQKLAFALARKPARCARKLP